MHRERDTEQDGGDGVEVGGDRSGGSNDGVGGRRWGGGSYEGVIKGGRI